MAWCYYKDLRRKVGCLLRVRDLPDTITSLIPAGHTLHWVKVDSRFKGRAVLQLASSTRVACMADRVLVNGIEVGRYTITVINVNEDLDWVVERS